MAAALGWGLSLFLNRISPTSMHLQKPGPFLTVTITSPFASLISFEKSLFRIQAICFGLSHGLDHRVSTSDDSIHGTD